MAKTRVIRKDLSEDEAKYLVEFSPPLRVSSLRGFPQLKLHMDVDPDDTPMRCAWIMTDAKSLSLFGTDKYGSNEQEPWYDQSSATSTKPMSANELLELAGYATIAQGAFIPARSRHEERRQDDAYPDGAYPDGALCTRPELIAIGLGTAAAIGFAIGRISTSR